MTRVATVDVGTNSVRLLVADAGDPLDQVERLMEITRLGASVDERGCLDDAALERTLAVIGRYAERWDALGAERAAVAATSAVRDARDRDRFLDGVRQRTGVEPRVLTGDDEADLSFRGAVGSIDATPPFLVLDIGGGSTELILGDHHPDAATSRQMGCVRITERTLRSDPPTSAQVDDARALVRAELDAVERLFDPSVARTLVGVAGTVTTLGALHLGLDAYEPDKIHATRVPLDGVAAIAARLLDLTAAERAALGPMQAGREDVIHGGAIVLEEVMRRFRFDEVLVSEADILDGLALELLEG